MCSIVVKGLKRLHFGDNIMDSRERVCRAVEFRTPDRIPYEWYQYGVSIADKSRSDILWTHYNPLKKPVVIDFGDEITSTDEWGCTWVSYKSIPTMGQPLVHPLQDWTNYKDYSFPKLNNEKRFLGIDEEVEEYRTLGKYIIGALDFGIWERLHFLRGLNETIMDLFTKTERVHSLLEFITDFKLELIKGYAGLGVDCVGFTDDWGDQSNLMIRPNLWVEVFKPYYMKIFQAAKREGMHTFLHSCGNISSIIGHLIDVGLDIIQIDAPHQNGVQLLSEEYLGSICFDCCIDIQKVLVTGDAELIDQEAKLLTSSLGIKEGGFIARQYPQLVHIGVEPEVNEITYRAFKKYETYD
jgi:hypothetical protein